MTSNYERWLDIGDATAGAYLTSEGVTNQREHLASNPAGVIAIKLSASEPGSLNFSVHLDRGVQGGLDR